MEVESLGRGNFIIVKYINYLEYRDEKRPDLNNRRRPMISERCETEVLRSQSISGR